MDQRILFGEGGKAAVALLDEPVVSTPDEALKFETKSTTGPGNSWTARGENKRAVFHRTVSAMEGRVRVSTRLVFREDVNLVSFADVLSVGMRQPDYVWTPSLCPRPGEVVGDHAFRCPLILLREGTTTIGVAPDLRVLGRQRCTPVGTRDHEITGGRPPALPPQITAFMNLEQDAKNGRRISVGFADWEPLPHVYYRLTGKATRMAKGREVELAYHVLSVEDEYPAASLRAFLRFVWDAYASTYTGSVLPQKLPFKEYVPLSLRGIEAIGEFREFTTPSGQPAAGFRNASGSTEHDIAGSYFRIPLRCVWFHAWHNSLRTAFGVRRYALAANDPVWLRRTEAIKSLALSAPDCGGGLIPAIYDYDRGEWWCGVTRLGGGKDILEIPASAETGRWMLLWHRHIESDPRLLERARRIAGALLSLQDKDGCFPGYLRRDGTTPDILRQSGMSGAASFFLAELCETEGNDAALLALKRSCDFYIRDIIPSSRYHDFETFFSCSEKPLDFYDSRTGQHAQNNLCLYWITEALLRTFRLTGERPYLDWGLYCLDQLSLYQQVWNPPYISAYTFGGFGVMNTDGEWNDLREVFFSRVYFLAYELTGTAEYFERGAAALRAGYALMSHPSHRDTNPLRYDTFPVGLTPENIAHGGWDGRAIRSGFDWGGGAVAAATALTDVLYGGLFGDLDRCRAFGIDGVIAHGIRVREKEVAVDLTEATGIARAVRVVFSLGNARRETVVPITAGCRQEIVLPLEDSHCRPLSGDEKEKR